MGSLRTRFAVLAGSIACLVALTAGGLLWALSATDRTLERTLAAQARLDLVADLSGRLTEYGLAAIDVVGGADPRPEKLAAARAEVGRALDRIDARLGEGVADTEDLLNRTEMAARSRPLSRLRAALALLERQIGAAFADPEAPGRGDAVRGALNAFGAVAGPALTFLVEAERRGVEAASAQARLLSERLRIAALTAAALALGALALLHRAIARPVLARIEAIRLGASAIGRGDLDTRLAVAARDELGLLVVSFNRMAARLARRERRVAADRAALEATIAQRTADLRGANARLEEADRSRRRFFADVSHELRTPLTVILGECDLAARAPPATAAEMRPVIATIRKRAQGLHRRVEDLLRVARSESGEIAIEKRPVSLIAVLSEAVENSASEARRRRVALVLEPGPRDVELVADPEWLRQTVEGLIDNALRHGAGATRVTVTAAETPGGVAVRVADDGAGFPMPAEGLLERFARAGDRSGGFGIGLALARWIVERHDGAIRLASGGDAGGAQVVLELPVDLREDVA